MHPIWGLHGPAAARTPGNGQQTWYRSTGNYKNGPRWPSGQADCYGLRMFGFPCKMKERVVHPKSWNASNSARYRSRTPPAAHPGIAEPSSGASIYTHAHRHQQHQRTDRSGAMSSWRCVAALDAAASVRAPETTSPPPPGRVRRRPRARAPASSLHSAATVVRSARGRVHGRRVGTGTATAAPHLYRGAATAAAQIIWRTATATTASAIRSRCEAVVAIVVVLVVLGVIGFRLVILVALARGP